MEKVIPISDLQSHAKKYVDQVKETEQPVVITQRGRAAAVLVSYEAFEGLVATRDEMSYPDWDRRLRRAVQESRRGKRVSLDAYVKRRARR
jgi:prevent-host-death family protein